MESSDKPENLALQKALQRLEGISSDDLTRLHFAYGASPSSYAARLEWRHLLQGIQNQHRLEHFGRKIYSQSEEDGIIEEIFRRLGITPRSGRFVEFGAHDGVEASNTLYLLHRKFCGLWIEASESHVRSIRNRFRGPLESGQLRVAQAFVTAENIDELLLGNLGNERDVALLSIDIDGNDFWVWKAIKSITPAVVVIEYNGTFPPPISIAQEYQPTHVYRGTDYFGASVAALAKLGRQKGYQLVGCNVTGVNAFFVRSDLVAEHFPYPLTAETLYHPCRLHLLVGGCFTSSGHVPDFGKYIEIDE